MAVAMASGSLAGAAQALCRNNEGPLLVKGLFGFSPRKLFIAPRQKFSPLIAPMSSVQASLATAVEPSQLKLREFVKLVSVSTLKTGVQMWKHMIGLDAPDMDGSYRDTDDVPIPKVVMDLDSDPDATVVEITFGDRLGALLDTMNALKNLGLNVVKANVFLDSSGKHNSFAITKADTGRKVEDPEMLEQIRLTIINNLIQYHPESSAQLAMGATFGITPPRQQVDVDIATHISIKDDGPNRSLLYVETVDHPGLLVELVKVITDINVNVDSGEFDTEGLLAKAKFHVSYRGKALIQPLQQVVANSLRYYLRRPTTEDASF